MTRLPADLASPFRGRLLNLSLLIASISLSLAVAEVFLRVFNPIGQRLMGDRIVLPRNITVSFVNKANAKVDARIEFRRNALGFRGPDPPRDFDRWLSVVAVGGSTTECLYLSEERSWPEVLARELSRSVDKLWVNNAGLDGHSSYGHLMLMRQMLVGLRPKVVLFLVGINDIGRENRIGPEYPREPPVHVRLARYSAFAATIVNLFRFAEARERTLNHAQVSLRHWPTTQPDPEVRQTLMSLHDRKFLPGYRARVRRLIVEAKESGILPVLITQPALYGHARDPKTGVDLSRVAVRDGGRMGEVHISGGLAWGILESYNEVVREEARAHEVPLVDVAQQLAKDGRYFYDFLHFTNAGAGAVARIVAAALCAPLADHFPEQYRGTCSATEGGLDG